MLHSKDYSPLRRRMFCPVEEKMVSPEEIVRGYEIGPEKYVLISDEELEAVTPERSRTIEISEFIDLKEVDPVYFAHPYYLLPGKGGEKAYRLLVEVMRRTGKAGLAKFVLGEREYLVAVRSMGGALTLIALHYSADLVSDEGFSSGEEGDEARKNRIKKTMKTMLADFDPGKYADRRRREIADLLKQKMKARAPVEAPEGEEEEGEAPPDLVAALKESMRRVKKIR
jgi:DNA end-binding protein Ku